MNYELPFLPRRPHKERQSGLTMVIDKGLGLAEIESFLDSSAEFVDIVKFGYATALISKNLEEKIRLYKQAGIRPYFGGTLFEAFIVRDMYDDFRRFIGKYLIDLVEISDGNISVPHDRKCEIIHELSQDMTVLSEVGSKTSKRWFLAEDWVKMMNTELQAGSWKVICEAKESGTTGIFHKDHSANEALIKSIRIGLSVDKVIWETPQQEQQAWFIKHFGANVNLGNISTRDAVALESLRLGLRSETMLTHL